MTLRSSPSVRSNTSSASTSSTSERARDLIRAAASGPSSPAIKPSRIETPLASAATCASDAGHLDRSSSDIEQISSSVDVEAHAEAALRKASPRFEPGASAIELKLSLIDVVDRLRPVNPVAVADLVVSLSEGPLGHPITVRPVDGRFRLVIGAHRLAAFVAMGRGTIPAQIRVMTELEARQLEIDENIVRSGLTALERLTFFAERVEVWAARNPDKVVMDASQPVKRRGRPPKHFAKLAKIDGYVPAMMGFVDETARDTGLSKRSVYLALQALSILKPTIRDRLHGTWIAKNDAALRQLAGVADPAEQAQVINILLDGRTKSIPEARALAAGTVLPPKAASNTVQTAFQKAWKAATPSERAGMLDWLSVQPLPKGWAIEGAGQ